jgi:hypothetical protein
VKTKYSTAAGEGMPGGGEKIMVQKGSLTVGFCAEEGEASVPKEVDLDLFRGSVKLLALLTEPCAANG